MAKLGAKRPSGVGKTFFQSLVPYLQNGLLSYSVVQVVGQWFQDEPHPSRRRFPAGHCGIYLGLFSQELRKDEKRTLGHGLSGVLVVFPVESLQPFLPEFFISQANQQIQNDIQTLRSVTKNLLSTLSVVKPKRSLKQLYLLRTFSTTPHNNRSRLAEVPELETIAHPSKSAQPHKPVVVNTPLEAEQQSVAEVELEDDFEGSFLANQLNRIVSIYENYQDSAELDTIYPIYQSLHRNDIDLPSIEEYNIVLKSICLRSLDNDGSANSIESKLTSLLTVYQDLLTACTHNESILPNADTYNIILPAVFDGAMKTIQFSNDASVSSHKYSVALGKAMDYLQVGSNLFLSIKNKKGLDASSIITPLLAGLVVFPHLLTKQLSTLLVSYSEIESERYEFYRDFILVATHFSKEDTLNMDKRQIYDFVSSVFAGYKQQLQNANGLIDGEFEIYGAMVETLLATNNKPVATKFLDQILIDFKEQLLAGNKSNMENMSALISTYLKSLMGYDLESDLLTSYQLLLRLRDISYLPEVTANVYNEMINRFIHTYSKLEYEKQNTKSSQVSEKQLMIYKQIWQLYEYAVIRKDFQTTSCKGSNSHQSVSCRDSLLSLSLDLGDHSNIARLIKEVLVKDHVIGDWNVSKKLCQYLYNGVMVHGDNYHLNLLWTVVEQQARHYAKDSTELNSFLSEHANFLLGNNSMTFSLVLNLMMIFHSFQGFQLLSDNAYGLMTISSFLFNEALKRQLSQSETIKILQYQSRLINEFEDPDNHYTELCPELVELKSSCSSWFTKMFGTLEAGATLTPDILQACSMLGLDNGNGEAGVLSPIHFELDLSAQLKLDDDVSFGLFVDYFNQGYSFTTLTWMSLATQNFAMTALEKEDQIVISNLASRIEQSKDASTIFASFINLKNDKVTIKLLQHLLQQKNLEVLSSSVVLNAMTSHATCTDNEYLLDLIATNVNFFYSLNDSPDWTAELFNKLNNSGRSKVVVAFSGTFNEKLANLDLSQQASAKLFCSIADACLNTRNTEQAGNLFRQHLSGADRNKTLLESNQLLTSLFNYYIACGAHEVLLNKFGSLKGRSPELDQLFEFSVLLNSLGGVSSNYTAKIDTEQKLALAILSEPDVMKMKELFDTYSRLIQKKSSFFDFMVLTLTKAAKLVKPQHHEQVISRFEAIIKLCKVLNLKEIQAKSLLKIIQLLAATQSKSLLNIIFNKFLIDNTILSTFNFYFLRVRISSSHESRQLLNEFRQALKLVGDKLNLKAIETFESRLVAA